MKNSDTAPIAVFAFNRPDHLRRTLDALATNELAGQSALTIFCDGPRNAAESDKTNAVRQLAKATKGFASVTVIERDRNLGCAASVIAGLTQMFNQHERLIVIEDDILTSPYTLRFLNEGLEFYADDKRIFNIAAWSPPLSRFKIPASYPHDIYAIPRFNCWGWASWRDRFEGIDWNVSDYPAFKASRRQRRAFNAGGDDMSPMLDAQMAGQIDSWAIRADYWRFKREQFGINPVRSYTTNIGMGSGTHCFNNIDAEKYYNDITKAMVIYSFVSDINFNNKILKEYKKTYIPQNSIYHRTRDFIGKKLPPKFKTNIKKYLHLSFK